MKFVVNAVRAVVVEMIGVIFVLWLVFGTAVWTATPASRDVVQGPSLGEQFAWSNYWESWSRTTSEWWADDPRQDEREVAARLDRYSQLFRDAATQHFNQIAQDL